MPRRPRIDWEAAFLYYASLMPWSPGAIGRWDLYDRRGMVRAIYPPDLKRTFANVGRAFGVSRQAVWKHARQHRWRARAREIDRRAIARASVLPFRADEGR